MEFNVTLLHASGRPVTVTYITADDSAKAGLDYVAGQGAVVFPLGVTNQILTVPILGDTLYETNKTFFVRLVSADGGDLRDTEGIGTIIDNDARQRVLAELSPGEGFEGDAQATVIGFPVTLSRTNASDVSVDYYTVNDTALAGSDYDETKGSLIIPAGATRGVIHVNTRPDRLNEADELFLLVLTNAVGVDLKPGRSQALGTIRNDDPEPSLSIIPVAALEGDTGYKDFNFRIRLSTPSGQTVRVGFYTTDANAQAGADYTATNGWVTLPSGIVTTNLTIKIIGDTLFEPDETFWVRLTNATKALLIEGLAEAQGTIQNDDVRPSLSIVPVSVVEGDKDLTPAVFEMRLSRATSERVTVNYTTADQTAQAGRDYEARNGVVSFAPGQTVTNLVISVIGDKEYEPNETFLVRLSQAVNAGMSTDPLVSTGTIRDDDQSPSILYGQVTDAVNGALLPGVQIQVEAFTVVTDGNGAYAISNVPPGRLAVDFKADVVQGIMPLTVRFANLSLMDAVMVQAEKSGYYSYTNRVRVGIGEQVRHDFSISPTNVPGLRLVLNWKEKPLDLDAHLLTPFINGVNYDISYIQKGSSANPPYAQLDIDRKEGFGPETITIARWSPGTYCYFVHNFMDFQGDTGPLRGSGATVQVYGGQGLIAAVTVPVNGEGQYWEICRLDGASGRVTIVNQIRETPPAMVVTPPSGNIQAATPAPLHYLWDFGDNTDSTEFNPVKTYGQIGRFTVKLTTTGEDGQRASETKVGYIQVSGENPRLRINRPLTESSQLVVEWDSIWGDFTLQSNTNLSAHEWIPVVSIPPLTNGLYRLIVPIEKQRYFRLSK